MTLVHLKMCNEHCAKFRMFMFLDAALFVIVCCVVVVVRRRVGKIDVGGRWPSLRVCDENSEMVENLLKKKLGTISTGTES